ncbi:polysaccharide deacetylase [Actinoplanes sp. SE50]|uniref:polysaccharide deacetylase family protein n=1 Tax=unclassified Actinoplanes TaxID=2626549 RepID=UPI00023EC9FF|nr:MULTISPECIES: polysaccharide deacetylase family protein [unclassified Actinoplanes]AEV86523.1 Putative polysaccharide deacetylase yxkH [Actinoplanes sp. SE50/110]ATO84921.1 polysaccharide deacetylase [Actinoplanes sp. SE50]SLM02330.1 polysaccharide deacetylase [Actinoplanes sp. SE50/110]
MEPPTAIKRRLNELGIRSRLRARPRAQGRVLAPAGLFRRLPSAPGLYFPFYHDVLPEYADDLRHHLRTLRRLGPMVGWEEALAVLAGDRPLTGPMFCLSFDDGHLSWRDVVVPVLRELSVPAMFFLTTGLVGQPGNLSWADCREIRQAGFGFGSHTLTHHRLADQDEREARREIADSKREMEDELGVPVLDFAAPYGNPAVDYTERDVRVAREAGYRSFASTRRPAMHTGDSPMWIHRQGLHPAWPIMAVRTRVHD